MKKDLYKNQLLTNKTKIGKGRIKNTVTLNETVSGKNATIRKKVLDEYSISDQLRIMRKAIISGDYSQLKLMDVRIDEILTSK